METNILLDVCEYSFQRIARVGNVQLWMSQVGEQVWKIPFHTVVGTPNSAMGVVPVSRILTDRSLFEKRFPLVVPEFQPQRELRFADMRKMPQE